MQKTSFRSWGETEKRCKQVEYMIKAGHLTPTEACKQIGVHHHTYHRWLMTRGSENLVRAVLNSNIKPGAKEEIVRRLSGKRKGAN